jgi:hypothetical protein
VSIQLFRVTPICSYAPVSPVSVISDMFQPSDLICSVQSTHNNIRIVGEQEELPAFVLKSLKEEVASLSNSNGDSTSKRPLLRSYE